MITVFEADYDDPEQAEAILNVLDSYSRDPMGQGRPLSDNTRKHLIQELKDLPTAFSILAMINDRPAGVANCVIGVSTFQAQKLVNIHDLAVMPDARERGIGQKLLAHVEQKARNLHCCKVTLEVRDDNRAKNLYQRAGFKGGNPEMLFWSKEL